MPFHDLNVPYTTSAGELSQTLSFLACLGYGVFALNLHITGKLPATPPEISIPKNFSGSPSSTEVLTRLTLTLSDPSQNHRLASLRPHYDLLALRPTTEKALQLACTSLDCDLISLDFSQRLPFILRFKTVAAALQRGVRFEICYAGGIIDGGGGGGPDARRNLIGGATALIRATRGRGIVISSEAKTELRCRGPWDVVNLAQVWGLGAERGKEAVCEEAGKVIRLAALKRDSFRGVVQVVDGVGRIEELVPEETLEEASKKRTNDNVGGEKLKESVGAETSAQLNGVKRKASTASMNIDLPSSNGMIQNVNDDDNNKPLSKKEMKRRAKKAKLDGRGTGDADTDVSAAAAAAAAGPQKNSANTFPMTHVSLTTKMSEENEDQKKGNSKMEKKS